MDQETTAGLAIASTTPNRAVRIQRASGCEAASSTRPTPVKVVMINPDSRRVNGWETFASQIPAIKITHSSPHLYS